MKKKFLAAIVAALLICTPLIGCGESYTPNEIEGKQDASYAVLSNGGSAVQYGNYMYFINGYRGYADEDGKQNYWGNVDKGGLYRAELLAGKDAVYEYMTNYGVVEELKTFKSSFDASTEYEFVTKEETIVTGYKKDNDGKIIYEDKEPVKIEEKINSTVAYRIASKTIGTSGYDKGGIFIYDEHVYYASPSNNQNRDGSFDTNKTMFYRTNLDGTGTVLLYTTKNDSASSEYAFYNQRGKVYLTVHDGSDIISVTVGENKTESVKQIATDVTAVLFPVKEVYYKGIDTNGVEDFIYYTRAIDENDKVRSGNIVVAMRPDGSEKVEVLSSGNTVTLRNVDSGYLFYEEARNGGNVIAYTNLHEHFMGENEDGKAISPTYREANEAKKEAIIKAYGQENSYLRLIEHQSGDALNIEDLSSYTGIICFRPDRRSNEVYSICYNSDGIFLYDGVEMKNIYSGTVNKVYAVKDTKVYFGDDNGGYFFTNAYIESEDNIVSTLGEGMNSTATFKLDIVGDYAVMFGEVDDYAADYAFFVNLDRVNDKQFVGVKADDDKCDPSVELVEDEEEA